MRSGMPLRLALATACLMSFGCDQKEPEPARKRFVAVEAKPPPEPTAWCDKTFPKTPAKAFEMPAVVADRQATVPPLDPGHWTWVNVWATWCGPCKEEMPMLAQWDKALDGEGAPLDLYYLSVDEDTAALDAFWKGHADLAKVSTARLTELTAMEPWLASYGLGAGTAIPIHVLVAPGGGVRCIRTGSVSESDLKTIKGILAKG